MKKIIKNAMLLLLLLMFSVGAKAQQNNSRYTIKAGKSISEVIPIQELFSYQEFKDGKVVHNNGKTSEARLNYNYLIEEMQFINGSDTLAIANENTLDYIVVEKDTFIYSNKSYYQLISSNGTVNLYERIFFKMVDIKNIGPYGLSSSTSSTDNLTSINNGGTIRNSTQTYNLKVNQDVVYAKRREYYIIGDAEELTPAKRVNILKLYPESKKKVKNFIKQQSINFDKKDDLLKLINYLKSINEQ